MLKGLFDVLYRLRLTAVVKLLYPTISHLAPVGVVYCILGMADTGVHALILSVTSNGPGSTAVPIKTIT